MGSILAEIAILDSQPLARAGLSAACGGNQFRVVYCGEDLAEVRACTPRPSVVVMDVNLGGRPLSVRSARELVTRGSALVAVGAHSHDPVTRRAVAAGALGFVSRFDAEEQFLGAIHAALNGQRWISPELEALVGTKDGPPSLSEKEVTALQLYAGGLKMEAVARRMQVAPSTAKEYIDRVRAKYSAAGRPAPTKVDLYHVAKQDGFIDN